MNVSPRQELPRESTRNRCGMSRQNGDFSQYALRLVENAELSQHRPPVVIDFFSGQTVIGIERVHTAGQLLASARFASETKPLHRG